MGQIRPSLGKGSNATIPRHMGFSTPICRRAVSDPFCIFFPMMIFWKIKVNYVYLANFKLESGLRIRVTILDRRRRQRVKHLKCLGCFKIGSWKLYYGEIFRIMLYILWLVCFWGKLFGVWKNLSKISA